MWWEIAGKRGDGRWGYQKGKTVEEVGVTREEKVGKIRKTGRTGERKEGAIRETRSRRQSDTGPLSVCPGDLVLKGIHPLGRRRHILLMEGPRSWMASAP